MTKSYNYIPTHFLYSPLLFFLLIFMHQLIHCHTLLQPFSKIFLFRIYVPTTYTPAMLDFDLDETSVSGFHKHTRQTAPANQSTTTPSTKSPRPYNPHKPIHQRHCPQPHTPQIPRQYSLHKHTQTHSTQSRPRRCRALDADVDVDTQTLLQHRCSRSPDALAATHRSAIGQARQTGSDQTKPDKIRPQPQLDRPGIRQEQIGSD